MKLYNTLTKRKEEFQPRNGKAVEMFVCGPTVYDYLHIGNGRTAITMDVLVRFLKHSGYEVDAIMNITDIDDKIIARAKEQGKKPKELTEKFEKHYLDDMENLGVKSFRYVRATDHITDIIKQVQTLLENGFAYKIDDGIYFEISKFKDYGKLSGRKEISEDDAQSRVDSSEQKRGWNDFCLWKFQKEDEPSWDAPFGAGRPGWHIEDTAITEHFFGPQYDIHGGGSDLIFPHHEAELTQMEAASGKTPFVKYWVHGGLLYTGGRRMGKSNENFITIHDALKTWEASAIRLFMLQGSYRSQLDFSKAALSEAEKRLIRLRQAYALTYQQSPNAKTPTSSRAVKEIQDALNDDLNTPRAIAAIEEYISSIVKEGVNEDSKEDLSKFIDFVNDVLGIDLTTKDISEDQKLLLHNRQTAKDNKDFEKADEIREQLKNQNIGIKDTDNGQIWFRV